MLIDAIRGIMRGEGVDLPSLLMQLLATVAVIFLILPLYEYAHGLIAYKLGDPTAKQSGRLTLNPLASIDKVGTLGLLLFGIGWAKPVPVNPRYFRNPKRDMALTALAGPVSNILAGFVGTVVYYFLLYFHQSDAGGFQPSSGPAARRLPAGCRLFAEPDGLSVLPL